MGGTGNRWNESAVSFAMSLDFVINHRTLAI